MFIICVLINDMSLPEDTAQRIRSALEPFVRPREEAAAIRRVLKAHLAASVQSDGDDNVLDGSSLGLVNLVRDTNVLPEARGLHKNYLRALQANLEARRAFDQKVAEAASTAALASSATASASGRDTPGGPFGARPSSNDPFILQDHLVTVKLGRKQDRLQTVNRYLDALAERPVAVAAGEDYLQPEFIYGDAETVLPSVPKAVVDGLAEDEAERAASAAAGEADTTEKAAKTTADLEKLVSQLEKSVLRSQLKLKEEEKRLAAARATSARREAITRTSKAAKLQALGAARDELIGWIETELGNAANGDDRGGNIDPDESVVESSRMLRQSLLNGHGSGDPSGLHDTRKKAELGEKLGEIQLKYAHYVQARKQLVSTVGSMSSGGSAMSSTPAGIHAQNLLFTNVPQLGPPQMVKKEEASTPPSASENTVSAADKAAALGQLLLVPYLERLLGVAHDQKSDISHKAHHNALLSKRLRDTSQLLDHLADESQLLPRYGPQGSRGAGGGAGSGAGGGAALLLRKKGVLAPASRDDTGPDGICQRVSAWTFAADSAKIATFESVFEQVEEGQVALEQATQALAEADMLLGREPVEDIDDDVDQEHVQRPKASDIWAGLDGEVGLLKSDNR